METGWSAWRKDAKWVCAIALTLFLVPALTLSGLYRINSPAPAQNLLKTLILASGFSNEFDSQFEDLKQSAQISPDELQQVDTFFGINLDSKEILNSSAQELKEKVAGEIAKRIYEGRVIRSPVVKNSPYFGVLQLFTFFLSEPANQAVGAIAVIFAALSVVFGLLTVMVSKRFGKPSSLGLAFVFGSIPSMLLFTLLGRLAKLTSPTLLGSSSVGESFANAVTIGLSQAEFFLAAGITLMLVGAVGGAVMRYRDAISKRGMMSSSS